jgi:hypothetical protein
MEVKFHAFFNFGTSLATEPLYFSGRKLGYPFERRLDDPES